MTTTKLTRRPTTRINRTRFALQPSPGSGGGGGGGAAPAVPTLTAPAGNVAVFNGVAVTLSATSTDGDLTRIDWILDPAGSATVVATDSVAPYSQSWTPTGVSDGDHILVARAVRGAQSTDSVPITINVGEVFHTLVSSVTCLRAWQSDFGVTDAGGGICSSWTDQKNSVNASQATGANRPTIVSNALGLHPALRFDGSNDFLSDATLNLAAPGTTPTFIWFVFTQRAWGGKSFCAGTTAGQMQLTANPSTPNLEAYDGTLGPANNGAAVGTPTRGEIWHNNTTASYLKLGSTSVTGTNTGNLDPPAGWNMGALSDGTGASNEDLYAVLIFSGQPSGAELAALSSAAAAMYPGLAV